MPSFSNRSGYGQPDVEITVREDAPPLLRKMLPAIAYGTGMGIVELHAAICRGIRRRGNQNIIWVQEYERDSLSLLAKCEWYKVYDAIESIHKSSTEPVEFTEEINAFFATNGIGWKLENGIIIFRGADALETHLRQAEHVLASTGLPTANTEMHQAINDLSRRPHADITGAIQHSLACLECVAREAAGGSKLTLGELIKKRPDLVPEPLNTAIEKVWGFSSNFGRHMQEGKTPAYAEAELMVGLSAALSTFLARKLQGNQ
jgi:hypothetical protein